MATVFLARDQRHERRVALKLLGADIGAEFVEVARGFDESERIPPIHCLECSSPEFDPLTSAPSGPSNTVTFLYTTGAEGEAPTPN